MPQWCTQKGISMYEIEINTNQVRLTLKRKTAGMVGVCLYVEAKQFLVREYFKTEEVFTITLRTGFFPKGAYRLFLLNAELLTVDRIEAKVPILPGGKSEEFFEAALKIALTADILEGYIKVNGFEFNFYDSLDLAGIPISSPAQIVDETNEIELGKKSFISFPVEERILILLHEYSHNFMNHDPDSESEADFWALQLFFAKYYPALVGDSTFAENRIHDCKRFLAEIDYELH